MRQYEVVCVLDPTLAEEEVEGAVESFAQVVQEQGAHLVSADKDILGKRRLAFPVKKFSQGQYVVLTLEEEAAKAVHELERRFRVDEKVIRFLTVRMDEFAKRNEKLRAKGEARKARLNARLRRPSSSTSEGAAPEPAVEPAKPKVGEAEESPVD